VLKNRILRQAERLLVRNLKNVTSGFGTFAQPTADREPVLALNDATAGFSATNDAIVEITGFTGSLTNLALI